MNKIHLNKSPILEALIDIHVTPHGDTNLQTLELLHEQIKSEYPTKRKKGLLQTTLEQKEGNMSTATKFDTTGFLFISQDQHQIIQYRLDGFTFSRLKPYETWEKLRDEARRLWRIYSKGVKVEKINRVALRYADLIEIPVGVPISDFIVNPPQVFEEGLSNLTAFLNQQRFLDPSTGIETLLTLSMQPQPGALTFSLVIDTDVFKMLPNPPSKEEEVWDLLERFRVLKNDIFFGIIAEKAVEAYK